jgi:hypothetical protein
MATVLDGVDAKSVERTLRDLERVKENLRAAINRNPRHKKLPQVSTMSEKPLIWFPLQKLRPRPWRTHRRPRNPAGSRACAASACV